jgi:hypothetical protein
VNSKLTAIGINSDCVIGIFNQIPRRFSFFQTSSDAERADVNISVFGIEANEPMITPP